MNTNHDAFENDLRALNRRELPAEWRNEILAAAETIKPSPRTPRWLVAGWGAAWAAILAMCFTMPSEPKPQSHVLQVSPARLWEARTALIENLLASN